MRDVRVVLWLVVTVLVGAAASAAQNRNFATHLSGDNEVAPVETRAQGQAVFTLSRDGTELQFRLIVANITDVFAAHIHLAPAGVNGPVVVTLYPGPPISGRVQGTLAQGTITAGNLAGPLAGQPLSALIDAMGAGNTYVNVHTTAHPGGEIRGQIR